MIGQLHISLSFFLSYLIFYFLLYFGKIDSIILSFFVSFLSIIPDYDLKIFNWSNKQIIFLRKTKLKYLLFPYYLFLIFLNKIFKHRTTTHTIFVPIFFFIFGFYFQLFHIISLAIFLHILEDSLTVSGVKIFYPLSDFELKIPLINTRKHILEQKILSILFLLLTAFIIVVY